MSDGIETSEYAAMLRRMIRAYGRRVAKDDPAELADMIAMRDELDAAIEVAVRGQRRQFSWSEVGAGLGITKQAAHARFR